jgi:hypothetical protein
MAKKSTNVQKIDIDCIDLKLVDGVVSCSPSLVHAELESSGVWGHSGVDAPGWLIN